MVSKSTVVGREGLTIEAILKVLVNVQSFICLQNNLPKIVANLGVDMTVYNDSCTQVKMGCKSTVQLVHDILINWTSIKAENATLGELIKALKTSGMNECVEALHRAFKLPSTDLSSEPTASTSQQFKNQNLETRDELIAETAFTNSAQSTDAKNFLAAHVYNRSCFPQSAESRAELNRIPMQIEEIASYDKRSRLKFAVSHAALQNDLETKEVQKSSEGHPLVPNITVLDSSRNSVPSTEGITPVCSSSRLDAFPSPQDVYSTEKSNKKVKREGKLWKRKSLICIGAIFLSCVVVYAFAWAVLLLAAWSINMFNTDVSTTEQPVPHNKSLADNTETNYEPPLTTNTIPAVTTSPLLWVTLRDATTARAKTTDTPISYNRNSTNLSPSLIFGRKRTKTKIQRVIASTPSQLKNHSEEICDNNFRTRIVLYYANSYDFVGYQYDCPTRIDGISFVHTNWFIDEYLNLLNFTNRLTHLVFNGSDICIRNEGYRNHLLGDISLYHLEHLEFYHLSSPGSSPTADCTELFSWLASNRVKDVTLKSLSFRGAMFTPKNRDDIHQLFVKAFNSNRLNQLNILASPLNVEMFNVKKALPSRNFTAIRFDVTNPDTYWAKKSLFNFINYFLNGSTTDTFSTNITLPFEKFRQSVKALHHLNVRTLEISVFIKDCDIVNFEFLHDIPNVLTFQMRLLFSVECQNKARILPIRFQRLGHLASSANYHEFRLISNADFMPEGAADLHCREYIKNNTQLVLNRNSKC